MQRKALHTFHLIKCKIQEIPFKVNSPNLLSNQDLSDLIYEEFAGYPPQKVKVSLQNVSERFVSHVSCQSYWDISHPGILMVWDD